MSAVLTACPHCKAQYNVNVENVGRKARCAKCGQAFVISTPGGPSTATRETDSPPLTACRFCGFQDSGTFCSNCGGRLIGDAAFDFDNCKIPQSYLSRFPSDLSFDINMSAAEQAKEQRAYSLRQNCEQFNGHVEEMARVVKYQGIGVSDWHFDRINVARFVDALPADVPGRELLVARLWTIVSDFERACTSQDVKEQTEEFQQAIKNRDVKKAHKAMIALRELSASSPSSGAGRVITDCESSLAKLQSALLGEKQSIAFQKLLDKADKLAFQQESKKAIKAYQECLFWLSRNELPDKNRVQTEVEKKLQAFQTNNPG